MLQRMLQDVFLSIKAWERLLKEFHKSSLWIKGQKGALSFKKVAPQRVPRGACQPAALPGLPHPPLLYCVSFLFLPSC